jgi:Flp pilus assembly protein TadB
MADPSETTQVSRAQEAELIDAVRALADRVESLQDDVRALRAESHALPPGETDRHGWDEGAPVAVREGPAWIRSVDSPRPRGIAVPWLLLEIVFLVAVAVLCAVAGLDAPVIVGVMVAAWVVVAIGEWLLSRAERERHALVYGTGVVPVASMPDDRSWFASNGDDTLLDLPSAERPPTRLPPPE